jgi:hypothetical protein
VLRDDVAGGPVLVRLQRPHETIPEAAGHLLRASRDKGARALFLIATERGGYLPLGEAVPVGVTVVEAPALVISDLMERFAVAHGLGENDRVVGGK